MPLEFAVRRAALIAQVNRDHPNWSQARKNAWVYGTLRHKFHWVPEREKRAEHA